MATRSAGAFKGGTKLLDPGMLARLRLAWRLLRDPRVPALKYVLPALLVVYVGSPIDLIPDVFLGIGQTDDVGVVVMVVLVLSHVLPWLAPHGVVEEHLRDMGGATGDVRAAPARQVYDAAFTVNERARNRESG